MDPILTPIVIILGKYALDKGLELGQAVGPKALETAKEMFSLALDRLRQTPKGEVVAGEFEQDPATYQKPVEKQLAEAAQADPDFVAKLKALYEQYETQAKEHATATGTSYQATISGTGAVAQGSGATATTATGGIAIGSVGGDVNMGDKPKDKPA
jgi:hypothetical protein